LLKTFYDFLIRHFKKNVKSHVFLILKKNIKYVFSNADACSAPDAGEYGLEIYANDQDVDGSSLHLVCQYLVVCDEVVSVGAAAESAQLPPPDLPPGFLGPQTGFRELGLRCASHDDAYIATVVGELQVSLRVSGSAGR